MTRLEALERAIQITANSQSELARRVGGRIKQQNVHWWLKNGGVPGDQAIPVSRAVDFQVTPHELCPDSYPSPWDGLPAGMAREVLAERAA